MYGIGAIDMFAWRMGLLVLHTFGFIAVALVLSVEIFWMRKFSRMHSQLLLTILESICCCCCLNAYQWWYRNIMCWSIGGNHGGRCWRMCVGFFASVQQTVSFVQLGCQCFCSHWIYGWAGVCYGRLAVGQIGAFSGAFVSMAGRGTLSTSQNSC